MIITKIQIQKNKKRVSVFLDEKFAFGLSLDCFIALGLKKGRELSPAELELITSGIYFDLFYSRALNLLSFRPRSVWEIEFKLLTIAKSKDIDEKIAKSVSRSVIKKLEKLKLINDFEFALWWIRQRKTGSPSGKIKLKAELSAKRIGHSDIDRALAQEFSEEDLKQALTILIEKQLAKNKHLPPKQKKQKIYQFLKRKGFSFDQCRFAVDQMLPKG